MNGIIASIFIMIHSNKNNMNNLGNEMYDLIIKLFPICRSITGEGVRETLKIIEE